VSAGASGVVLNTAGDSALFTVGNKLLISGFETQAGGYPTNPYYYEFPKLASIAGTTTKTLTFASPLVNSYKTTWPSWGTTPPSGPAYLYALESGWECDHEYIGLGLENLQQTNSIGEKITYTGGYSGGFGIYPTRNVQWTTNGYDMYTHALGEELDKIVWSVKINGGSTTINTQSASPTYLDAECVSFPGSFQGTPKNTTMFGCVVSTDNTMKIGPHSYGRSETFYAEACSFAGFDIGGQVENDILGAGAYQFPGGGIIKRAMGAGTTNPPVWCVPGGKCTIGTTVDLVTEFPFQITDVTTSGSDLLIQTTLNGFPTLPVPSGTYTIRTHPAPDFTVVDCQGGLEAVDFTGATDASIAFRSYTKRSLTDWTTQQQASTIVAGRLVSMTINVATAYTGVLGTLTLNPTAQFGAFVVSTAGTLLTFNPVVNVMTAGTRVITPTSVTGTKSGDQLGFSGNTPPGEMWFTEAIAPHLSASISGESSSLWPVVTVELVLDQSPEQQALFSVPLRFRLAH
jgi:hypothetical protein